MKRIVLFFCLWALCPAPTGLADDGTRHGRVVDVLGRILQPRDRVEPVRRMLTDRLDNLLPGLMRETGIDLWLVINREYNEDPVYKSLVPDPVFAARRTTMLVFFDRGGDEGVERFTISRYPIAGLYEAAWEGGSLDEQWQRLAALIAERDPKRIGINTSRDWAVGDGLSAGMHRRLMESLDKSFHGRVVSAADLCIRWLETRTAAELEVYPHIVAIARAVIGEAFSERVVTPGVTRPEDVAWYIRERFEELGLQPWFQPYVNVQRRGDQPEVDSPFFGAEEIVIQRGDVLHTDVGICYLRLCTDTQEMGYVLRLEEDDVPAGLREALQVGTRWQDLLTAEFSTGRRGNEILSRAIAASEKAGIRGSIYTHPLGFFGHAPGPTIGMWDNQGPTLVQGDWKLHPSTAYAVEGNVKVQVAEWDDQWVQIKLEQSAFFDGEQVHYLAGRQTRWHVVR